MGNWSPIARALNAEMGKSDDLGRIGKQCRERWNHHLMPDIKKVHSLQIDDPKAPVRGKDAVDQL